MPWRSSIPTFARAAVLGLSAVIALIAAAVIVGGRDHRQTPLPTTTDASTPPASATNPVATAAGLLAPLGYSGGGTIEYTKHDVAAATACG